MIDIDQFQFDERNLEGENESNSSVKIEKDVDQSQCFICGNTFLQFELEIHYLTCKEQNTDHGTAKSIVDEILHDLIANLRIKEFQCEKCNKKFVSKHTRNDHIKIVHDKVKRFQCNKCDRYFGVG